MPSRRTTGRILLGSWIALALLYVAPPALLLATDVDFAICIAPLSRTDLVFLQLLGLLLVPWVVLAWVTWRWRRSGGLER